MNIYMVMSLDTKGSICGLIIGDKDKPYVTNNLLDAKGVFSLEENYIKKNYPLSRTFDGNTISCVITKVDKDRNISTIKHGDIYDFE